MTNIAIVYHSGYGHTQAVAEAVAAGARGVAGARVNLIPVAEAEAREAELDAADAIVFGSPTYMGGVSADFAKFKDWTAKRWMARAWQNKLAAGFTVSASWGGDKQTKLGLAISDRSIEQGFFAPVGQYKAFGAYRKDRLEGWLASPVPVLWNISKKN